MAKPPEMEKVGPNSWRFAGVDTGIRIGLDLTHLTLRERLKARFFPKAWEAELDAQMRAIFQDAFAALLGQGWMRVKGSQEGVKVERIPPEDVYRHG